MASIPIRLNLLFRFIVLSECDSVSSILAVVSSSLTVLEHAVSRTHPLLLILFTFFQHLLELVDLLLKLSKHGIFGIFIDASVVLNIFGTVSIAVKNDVKLKRLHN